MVEKGERKMPTPVTEPLNPYEAKKDEAKKDEAKKDEAKKTAALDLGPL